MCTSRRLIEAHNEAKSGGWKTWSPFWMTGPGLMGSTVGIVGFGRIGQSIAKKLKAFDTSRILYYNRSDRSNEALPIGAERADLDELLKESDFVICSCALSKDTEKMFNAETFGKMKKTALFINTSRGGLVDQAALVEALRDNVIRGAGLDVTIPEPLPLDSPLFKLNNCVILPHIGSASIEARTAMSQLAVDNIIAGLKNEDMPAELHVNI